MVGWGICVVSQKPLLIRGSRKETGEEEEEEEGEGEGDGVAALVEGWFRLMLRLQLPA